MQSGHDAEAAASNDAIARILRTGNKETFDAAKDAIMKRVLLATVQEAIEDLGSPDDIAERALQHLEEEQTPLLQAVVKVKERLLEDVARRSTDELADAEATAQQARAHIDDEHEAVVGAVDELKHRLIHEIARRSTDELADAEAAAQQAQALIGDEHAAILQAIDTLKGQILETIVQQSLAKISDAVSTPLAVEELFQPQTPRKPYVKTSIVEARPPAPSARVESPEAPSSAPQMRRKKTANGYVVEDSPLAAAPPAEEAETPDTYYVYGIVANQGLVLADALADADIDPPYTPYLMPYQSVAAIVSCLPGTMQQAIRQEDLHRVQERILEQVNAAGIAVLPMYAETTHPSQEHLQKALARYVDTLDTALKTLDEKQEWNVKIYCDSEKVQQEVYARDETIDSFLEQFVETAELWSDAGAEVELEALQEGMDTSLPDVVENLLDNCQKNCHRMLHMVSLDSRMAPASDDSVFGNSRMVLNASYLVAEDQGESFRVALERLAIDYEKLGLVYYIGGPNPPCRFASAETPML